MTTSWTLILSVVALSWALILATAWLIGALTVTLEGTLPWIRRLMPVGPALGLMAVIGSDGTALSLGLALGALATAGLFYGIQAIAPQPDTTGAVRVGQRIIDFTTLDAAGRSYNLSQATAGKVYLLKFYRGHW